MCYEKRERNLKIIRNKILVVLVPVRKSGGIFCKREREREREEKKNREEEQTGIKEKEITLSQHTTGFFFFYMALIDSYISILL